MNNTWNDEKDASLNSTLTNNSYIKAHMFKNRIIKSIRWWDYNIFINMLIINFICIPPFTPQEMHEKPKNALQKRNYMHQGLWIKKKKKTEWI